MAIAGPSALRRIRAPREIAFILSKMPPTIVPTDRKPSDAVSDWG